HYDYQAWYRTRDDCGLVQNAVTHELFKESIFAPATIGVDETKRTPAPGSSPPSAALGAPPTLRKIDVHASIDYTITYQGLEALAGKDAYHLHLTALHGDRDHPLTDLGIDPTTFLIRKASAAATGRAVVAGGGGSGDVLFSQVGKYWMATGFDVHVAAYALRCWKSSSRSVAATATCALPAARKSGSMPTCSWRGPSWNQHPPRDRKDGGFWISASPRTLPKKCRACASLPGGAAIWTWSISISIAVPS
ncbi:MAG: hypothetical protein M3Z37_01425, partial [Candidatus Eremiobacteraeota bacterium]|nr:hypothetical protein [Candidatus Eremiobacteraeota bacterium]